VDQEGRLFRPLAFTKNFVMAIAAILAVTLDPALRMIFARMDYYQFRPRFVSWIVNQVAVGKYYKRRNTRSAACCSGFTSLPRGWCCGTRRLPLPSLCFWLRPPCRCTCGSAASSCRRLNEGTILYMPSTLPGISVSEAQAILQRQDQMIRSFPEVERVYGKAGRAETSTDPAPFSMMETTVMLKPPSEWRFKKQWYSDWAPGWLKKHVLSRVAPEHISWTN